MHSATPELEPTSAELPDAVARVARSVVAVAASRRSVGAGAAWRDGLLVAAAHRVWRAERTQVLLPDGESVAASVKGIDAGTDLALLAPDGGGAALPGLDRADDGREPRAGDFVFAVARDGSGMPSASFGHIGAAAGAWRSWRGGRIDRLIRLDGGLYPGFSGAPVSDAHGGAIGIATSALTRMHGIVLPWSTVDRVLAQLQAHGRIVHAYLGVALQPVRLPDAQASALGVVPGVGLLVTGIADDGPAAAAGLLLGDTLLAIGGVRVQSIDELRDALDAHAVGSAVEVLLARGGERRELQVQLGERARGRCG